MRQPHIVMLHAWRTVQRKMQDWGDAFAVWNGGNTPIIMTAILSLILISVAAVVTMKVSGHVK
jgi:hypothetical protein